MNNHTQKTNTVSLEKYGIKDVIEVVYNPSYDFLYNEELSPELKGFENRKANFKTVIALILNQKHYFFEGAVHGFIRKDKKGGRGFGYDPIFQPIGYKESFAEMSITKKNEISHRGLAIKKLINFFSQL
mgnify:CR=1 FL=1